MEYIEKTLGLRVKYTSEKIDTLPSFYYDCYDLKVVKLDGIKAIFVYPKEELNQVNDLKKRFDRIYDETNSVAVLIVDCLTFRQREFLIKNRVPFVVTNKQIYLPFMGTYIKEKCDSDRIKTKELLPSAQVLLLHFIYEGCNDLPASKAGKVLSFTPTSISRAVKQLLELKLIESHNIGTQRVLTSDLGPKKLFLQAKKYLLNPIKRTIYCSKEMIKEDLLIGSNSAICEYSNLAKPDIEYYANASISKYEKFSSWTLMDENRQCAIELWRYDPRKLTNQKCVDRLSIALALNDDHDPRVKEAIEDMLNDLWKELNDKRN